MTNDTLHQPQPARSDVLWNLNELRDNVERIHGSEHGPKRAKDAWKSAQSILKRIEYMRYHYKEVQRLVGQALEAPALEVLTKYVFQNTGPDSQDFADKRSEAEAHLVAFLQSGHAILDTLGFVIYSALNIETLRPSDAYFGRVQDLLPDGDLKDKAQELLDDPEIKHLSALVNHSKHRRIVEVNTSVSFVDDGGPSHGLRLDWFTYKERSYPARWANEFTETIFDRLQYHALGIGPALNALVKITPARESAQPPDLDTSLPRSRPTPPNE